MHGLSRCVFTAALLSLTSPAFAYDDLTTKQEQIAELTLEQAVEQACTGLELHDWTRVHQAVRAIDHTQVLTEQDVATATRLIDALDALSQNDRAAFDAAIAEIPTGIITQGTLRKLRGVLHPPAPHAMVGQSPELSFTLLDGSVITPADVQDKLVVVDLWATWCLPCLVSMPHTAELEERYGDDVMFIALSLDEDREHLVQWLETRDIPGRIAHNGGGAQDPVAQTLGVTSIPTLFILRDGEIIWGGHPNFIDRPLYDAVQAQIEP